MKKVFVISVLILTLLLGACGTPAAPLPTVTPLPPPTATLSPEALKEAVFDAVRKDDVDAVKRYIAAGADANERDDMRATLLSIASFRGNEEMLKLLLNAGATFDIGIFHLAISYSNDNTEIVQAFIDHGADVNAPADGFPGHTALMYAAEFGHIEVGKFLLANGADINGVDDYNDPAVNVAAFHGQLEFVKMLMEHGAELNMAGYANRTALGHALNRGHEDVVLFLREAGAVE